MFSFSLFTIIKIVKRKNVSFIYLFTGDFFYDFNKYKRMWYNTVIGFATP